MENVTRDYYYKKKHTYLFFHTLLLIARILGLVLFGGILLFVILYSYLANGQQSWNEAFKQISKIVQIVTPIILVYWISVKIVVVVLKKKILELKHQAGVLDEI